MSSEEDRAKLSSSQKGERKATSATEPKPTLDSEDVVPTHHTFATKPPPQQAETEKRPKVSAEEGTESTAATIPPSSSDEKSPAKPEESPEVPGTSFEGKPRQVIAVSVSKGPAAFFNLARKFLVTDEMVDLSALEGAIVSAVDAAHLLERSKLATIVRIQTSYVTVEPKRKKLPPTQQQGPSEQRGGVTASASSAQAAAAAAYSSLGEAQTSISQSYAPHGHQQASKRAAKGPAGVRELRRARIVITVRRTESYKQWLQENPLQAVLAGDADDPDASVEASAPPPGKKET